jgi:hypothetical protein
MTRHIGIRHRIKKTVDGEARPTQLFILETDASLELEDDNAELDWVRGTFPVSFRKIRGDDDLLSFNPRHIKWRTVRKDQNVSDVDPSRLRRRAKDGKLEMAHQVPTTFDGLKQGDVYGMSLGGSGDRLAFALSRVGESKGAVVKRLPPVTLKASRGEADKDEDSKLIAKLVSEEAGLFHAVTANTRRTIQVRERHSLRIDTMKARIACGQRLRQRFIGQVFCQDGEFEELDIEAQFEALKANDLIFQTLVDEEKQRLCELLQAIKQTAVWQEIFEPFPGIAEALAGRLISAIGSFERFMVEPDQEEIDRLYRESVRCEREAGVEELRAFVHEGSNHFQTLQRMCSWCQGNGRPRQAALLEVAIEAHRMRSRARNHAKKQTRAKLKSFCGVAVNTDGRFMRRRSGEVANWHPDCRQALYLLGEQFNRQGDRTHWGCKLREYKEKLRAKHPEVIEVDGKKRYTNGHIHKMATWRTLTKFVEWLADEWSDLIRRQSIQEQHKLIA